MSHARFSTVLLGGLLVNMFYPSVLAALTVSNSVGSCAACCAALLSALPTQVFIGNGSTYQEFVSSYWSQQEQSIEPLCLVQPESAKDVSIAVKILSAYNHGPGSTYAHDVASGKGCQFAIKSGGHAPFPGAANIESGVTIDLSLLNSVDIHADSKTASIGTGNRWGAVYSALQSAGYTVPGGRDTTVGVGGLTLGGGMSFLSPRVGFVCDAATNFEVVLASGAIVNANARTNKDLFRALKGGSNNFGVVTKIDLPLIDPNMWGGFLYTDIALRGQAFDFFVDFANSPNYDEYAAFIDSNVYVNGSWLIALQMTYTKPGVTNPPVFAPMLALPAQSTLRQTTHLNLTAELGSQDQASPRALWVTLTIKNDAALMETFFQLGNATTIALQSVPGLFLALSFQPVPQIMIQRAKANGGDALGLDASDGNLAIWNVGIFWNDAADDDRIYAGASKLQQDAMAQAKKRNLLNEYIYLNYAARYNKDFTQNVIEHYGPESVAMLKAASARYDPTGLFQKAVPGGFKIQP